MTETPTPLVDPGAPREHKLPSGLTVTLASHRTLRRPDIHRVWASVTDPDMAAAQEHDTLMGMLATAISDPSYELPLTTESLDRLDPDDYLGLYRLVDEAYRLVHGLSVIPRQDDYEDPKAPTTESNGSAPGSRGTMSSPSPGTTGTTSATTSTSTEPADGPQPS